MRLKAYRVDNPGEWSTLVYAETAAKAKMIDWREFHEVRDGFDPVLGMRAVRVPQCDQFMTEVPGVDLDALHQMMAGITQLCWHCDREIHAGDPYEVTVSSTVVCPDCYRAWEAA